MAYTAPVVAQRSAALHSISLRTFRNVRTATVRLRCDAVAQCVNLLAQEPKKLPQMCGHRERKAGDWNCYKSGGRPATAAQTRNLRSGMQPSQMQRFAVAVAARVAPRANSGGCCV